MIFLEMSIYMEGTVNEFLERIERMVTHQTGFLLSDLDLNPFNPLPESVDSLSDLGAQNPF